MAIRRPYALRLYLPGKQGVQKATLLLLTTFGLVLFVMSKSGNPSVTRMKATLSDVMMPVMDVAARPFDAVSDMGAWVSRMGQLASENTALKEENRQLLRWQAAARDMEAENRSLKSLLHVVPGKSQNFVTVRMVSDAGGPYVRSSLINGGSDDGIRKDQVIMNDAGLVGRVIDSGKSSAHVLLLSDINSRVPVIAEKSREKSILVGNNDNLPTLAYLSMDSHVAAGERLLTSGDGGVFPAGIPVGTVLSVDKGAVQVQLFADPAQITFVSAVDYSF